MGGLLQIRTVADLLACTKRHIYVLIRQGELEAYQVGTAPNSPLKVSKASLKKFMERQKIDPEKYFE